MAICRRRLLRKYDLRAEQLLDGLRPVDRHRHGLLSVGPPERELIDPTIAPESEFGMAAAVAPPKRSGGPVQSFPSRALRGGGAPHARRRWGGVPKSCSYFRVKGG